MKKKWNLLFLFAFIVSMITLAGCGKTAGEASPYEGKWIAVSAQMIGMSVSVDETFGGAFEFEVKNGGKVSFSVGEVTGNGKWSAKDDKFSLTIEGEEMVGTIGENNISFDDMLGMGVKVIFAKEGTDAMDPAHYLTTVRKVDGAEKYQITYSTKSNFKKAKTVTVKKASASVKKFKSKKTYYVKVRALKTIAGKTVKTGYSNVKKVKVK